MVRNGQPQHRQARGVHRGGTHLIERSERIVQQRLLEKQVAAGVSRQAQFRQDQQPHLLLLGLPQHLYQLLRVVRTVRHADLARGNRYADPSVLHWAFLPTPCFLSRIIADPVLWRNGKL